MKSQHAKDDRVRITDSAGNTRDASPAEAAHFRGFCAHMDSVDKKLKSTVRLAGWTWEHTGGGICLAYLPVVLKETPGATGEREVSLSLGGEGVEITPFRVEEFERNPHRKAVLPDGKTEEIGELLLTEYGVLGAWDKRFWGTDVYEEGWRGRVRAWCERMIASPDPGTVARDIVAITEKNIL